MKRIRPLFKLVSFWALVATSLWLAFPLLDDSITRWFVRGYRGYAVSVFLNVFLLGLVVDVIRFRRFKFFLILPILVYGSYYTVLFSEQRRAEEIKVLLEQSNPTEIGKYDPQIHNIIFTDMNSHVSVNYKIPVVYELGRKTKSYRWVDMLLCKKLKDKPYKQRKNYDVLIYRRGMESCRLTIKKVPKKRYDNKIPIYISKKHSFTYISDHSAFLELKSTFKVGDEPEKHYISVIQKPLPFVPVFRAGCGVLPSLVHIGSQHVRYIDERKCFVRLRDARKKLDNQYMNLAAELLGIEKYTDEEIQNFRTDPKVIKDLEEILEIDLSDDGDHQL